MEEATNATDETHNYASDFLPEKRNGNSEKTSNPLDTVPVNDVR